MAKKYTQAQVDAALRNAEYRKAYHGARQAGIRAEHNALKAGADAEKAKAVFVQVRNAELDRRLKAAGLR